MARRDRETKALLKPQFDLFLGLSLTLFLELKLELLFELFLDGLPILLGGTLHLIRQQPLLIAQVLLSFLQGELSFRHLFLRFRLNALPLARINPETGRLFAVLEKLRLLQFYRQSLLVMIPHDGQVEFSCLFPGFQFDSLAQFRNRRHVLPVHSNDDVSRLQARLRRRTTGHHLADQNALYPA